MITVSCPACDEQFQKEIGDLTCECPKCHARWEVVDCWEDEDGVCGEVLGLVENGA